MAQGAESGGTGEGHVGWRNPWTILEGTGTISGVWMGDQRPEGFERLFVGDAIPSCFEMYTGIGEFEMFAITIVGRWVIGLMNVMELQFMGYIVTTRTRSTHNPKHEQVVPYLHHLDSPCRASAANQIGFVPMFQCVVSMRLHLRTN